MAVSKRKNGTWQVQLVLGRDARTGKPQRASWTFDTRREAEAFEGRKKVELQQQAEMHVHPSMQKLDDYLQGWLQRKDAEGLSAKTLLEYRKCVAKVIVPALGRETLADISPTMVQRWQDGMATRREQRGAAMAALAFRVLRSALSDAHRLGMIASNPAKAARPAMRSPRKREGFTLEEARAVLVAAQGERLEPLFAFVLHSGLRDSEALGLRWRDVDLDHGMLTVARGMVEVNGTMVAGKTKTAKSARTFAMFPQALDDLRRQRGQQARERLNAGQDWRDLGLVFAAENGQPLRTSNVARAFRRVRERAAVRALPLYSMRHATASILLGAGVPVGVAAKMMGHSVAMFCETYADLLVEATRDAADMAGRFLDEHSAAQTAVGEETAPAVPIRKRRPRAAR